MIEPQGGLARSRQDLKDYERAALDAACYLASAEDIPPRIVSWAREQPYARYEIQGIRDSVSDLRRIGVHETRIQAALAADHFLQAIFTLKREVGLPEMSLLRVFGRFLGASTTRRQ
jgi:hypothetical protein